jgi:3-deoxy-7-phosphoheptulonate synthase
MRACGIDTESHNALHEVDVYTSHEALILGYEQALTRQDSLTGNWYDCSAHMLWIGERTRDLDGAHVEFLSGRRQPDRLQGRTHRQPRVVLELCQNSTRLGCRAGSRSSPGWVPTWCTTASGRCCGRARDADHPVVWACDPMHGNTFTLGERPEDPPLRRHRGRDRRVRAGPPAEGTWPGGIHIELTGENVTECLGGGEEIFDTTSTTATRRCAIPG